MNIQFEQERLTVDFMSGLVLDAKIHYEKTSKTKVSGFTVKVTHKSGGAVAKDGLVKMVNGSKGQSQWMCLVCDEACNFGFLHPSELFMLVSLLSGATND